MSFTLKKHSDGSFHPVDEHSQEESIKVPYGALIKCEFIKNRNYGNLQRYHVAIDVAWKNMLDEYRERFSSKDKFRKFVEGMAGHCTEYKLKDGSIMRVVDSISYESIKSEDEFNEIFDRVLDVLIKFTPAWTKEDFVNVVEQELLGFV
jgi:hypothetical protein